MIFLPECISMGAMQKFIFVFLMFLVTTPALACGSLMPCVPMESKVTQEAVKPCHGDNTGKDAPSKVKGVMLFKDCAQTDLAGVDAAPILKASDSIILDILVFSAVLPFSGSFSDAAYSIRGPPDMRLSASFPALPVFLTTQRLRL